MSSYEYQMQAEAARGSYQNQETSSRLTGTRNSSYSADVDQTAILPYSPFAKQDDLKSLLESSKDSNKLEAMKRLITMVAKGKHSTEIPVKEIFPYVVKNVVTKNAELKKLVYLYLLRYAEQEPDLILLSISTFQRSLKDPNPLIRASALRVLSSIRVNIIAPIMYISIKDCANDMSPYVRKTAAHAIPKLYSLEPEMRAEIIMLIEKLLEDKTSLVLSSAVAAFEEVCPDRLDLIHSNYRKFVSLMADFDEWGQVVLINLLLRYGRTQFVDPNLHTTQEIEGDSESNYAILDQDHRMLLRNAKPLLQSRNSAVVLSVIQLYLYLAPKFEIRDIVAKPFMRLLHSKPEIQIVVLTNILTLTSEDDQISEGQNGSMKGLFEPYIKSFFIKSRDATQVKILKLKIITNLSSSSNIPLILREFQAYINNYQEDMEFVSATIAAIGKCASRIKEIAPVCLTGLISLLSNRNESITAQSIIVLRGQIIDKFQSAQRARKAQQLKKIMNGEVTEDPVQKNEDTDEEKEEDSEEDSENTINLVIKQISKLFVDKIKTPSARATILWIIAEFCDKNCKAYELSPDILRLIAKTFIIESDRVKLQAINLAAKVYVTVAMQYRSPEDDEEQYQQQKSLFDEQQRMRIKQFVNYIFNLAKYDYNYDVRDRARFLKQLISNCDHAYGAELLKRVLMSPKNTLVRLQEDQVSPDSNFTETNGNTKYRIGTLSHFVDKAVTGYEELPDFPIEAPDTSVRKRPEDELAVKMENSVISHSTHKTSYASSLNSDSSTEDSEEDSESDSESTDTESSESSSSEESDSDSSFSSSFSEEKEEDNHKNSQLSDEEQ